MTTPRPRLALTSSLAVIGLLASGCANQVTAYRTQRIGPDGPMVITTDAYQRHLVMTPDAERAGMWRTCAEASPDVFSAISGSGAGDLGFNSTSERGVDAQARAAMSIAQSAATAERTQTINLLRESMFRTCERYMNGAIDQATLVVQAGRDWRAMIAILAIEQLDSGPAPAFHDDLRRRDLGDGDRGRGCAARSLEAAQEQLETANDHLTEARALTCPATPSTTGSQSGGEDEDEADDDSDSADSDSADTDESASDSDSADSDSDDADASTDADPPATTPPAAQSGECDSKKTAIEEATTEVQQAEAAVAAARAKVNQAARSGAGTTPGTTNSAGGGGGRLSPAALKIVAPVVERIVDQTFGTDETQLFCLQILSRGSGYERYRQLITECTTYLMARVISDQQRLLSRADLRALAVPRADAVRATRTFVLSFLDDLTDEEFPAEAALIREQIAIFCPGFDRVRCIRSIEDGRLDGLNPSTVRAVIQQRIDARSQR